MILDREYNPSEDELIYHYCRSLAFVEITNNRSIWLSAYWTMNDETERQWGYAAFNGAIKELKREVDQAFLDKVYDPITVSFVSSAVMISSFSLDGDVPSQWAKYADDGRGFAIGFSAKLTKHLPVRQLRVLYDEDLQIRELLGNLRHIYEYEKSIGFKYDEQFKMHLFHLGGDLCAYKNPAFKEEQEIRLVHMSGFVPVGDSGRIAALGARDQHGRRQHRSLKVHFRDNNGIVTPYVILDYSKSGPILPIKEVLLGPRNENAESNIKVFLNTIGMKDVVVRRSKVP
jgi:Protein of unknown function (DUF2971)